MKQRVISGAVGAAALVLILLQDKIYLNIGMTLISFIALNEVYNAVGLAKYLPLRILGLAASFGFTFAYSFNFRLLMPLFYIYIFALFALYMLQSSKLKLHDISKMFFITIFISFFLVHIVFIRKLEFGEYLIWMVFISAFLTDTAAYITGRLLGRHKLCPRLSPKKTVEGAIGGVIGGCAGVTVYGVILQFYFGFGVNYPLLALLGVAGSLAAQFGDLAASRIKRQYDIKDYGNVMPGHGGVMDRFDSVIFTAPIVYFIVSNLAVIFIAA